MVTKIWSHNVGKKNIVQQSLVKKNLVTKSVTKFWLHNFGHKICYRGCVIFSLTQTLTHSNTHSLTLAECLCDFFVERLHDFFLVERLRDFFCLRSCMNLHNFCVWRGCVIFLSYSLTQVADLFLWSFF